MITLEGQVEAVTYQNPENHYTIARLKIRESKSLVTLVGYLAGISSGQSLAISGRWENHPKFGQQFKVEAFHVTLPATVEGIRTYLESDVIKGIGPLMANRLIRHFGTDTLDVIENHPEKLLEVNGIGPSRADQIHHSWMAHHTLRRIMQFLQDNGVKASHSSRIWALYGEDAVELLSEDPYRLAEDLPGVGFPIADTIARSLGTSEDDPRRLRTCIRHLIEQTAGDGHVMIPEDLLLERAEKLYQISSENGSNAVRMLSEIGEIVLEEADPGSRVVYPQVLYQAERGIAFRLKAMLSFPPLSLNREPEELAEAVVGKLAIRLSSEQLSVLQQVLTHPVAIITGGPGTGKTTLIRSVNAILQSSGKRVLMAAPTGRAARRLSELTLHEAQTIHRLLGYNFRDGYFEKDQDSPLEADAVIVDEASMVDTFLMYHLICAIPVNAALILVGDVFQLPSVGPGNVLEDLIRSKAIPVYYLTQIFRQARESDIIVNAHMVRRGEHPDLSPAGPEQSSDFYFIHQADPHKAADLILRLCRESIPDRFGFDPIHDVQVLTPMHKGAVGTLQLNRLLQKALNPETDKIENIAGSFKLGDKVMHLKNNYQKDIFNGDIGVVAAVNPETSRITVDYYGRNVLYEPEELHELTLAYAITVHKSQGSEYPAVVVPLMTEHYPLLQRNLLYTAITRGKRLVVLVGNPRAFAIALNNDKPRQRFTRLAEKLA